jgi:MraZ protein
MFYRLFHQGAKSIALDGVGRVLIPAMLMERVGLDKDVMLIAYNDRIEIWDKTKYFELIGPKFLPAFFSKPPSSRLCTV